MAKHLLIMAFLPAESNVRMSILPSVNTLSYSFLLIIFALFQAQCFIIRQKVRENRNIFGLLCLRLIFLFLIYSICVTKQRVFTFKLLVACLRPVTRPLFTQKWATFYP
jgi:uncharacterized membrane protein